MKQSEINWSFAEWSETFMPAAQQRKAKAIPIHSLRMDEWDCFAFSLRACRPKEWMNWFDWWLSFLWINGGGASRPMLRKKERTSQPIKLMVSFLRRTNSSIVFFLLSSSTHPSIKEMKFLYWLGWDWLKKREEKTIGEMGWFGFSWTAVGFDACGNYGWGRLPFRSMKNKQTNLLLFL